MNTHDHPATSESPSQRVSQTRCVGRFVIAILLALGLAGGLCVLIGWFRASLNLLTSNSRTPWTSVNYLQKDGTPILSRYQNGIREYFDLHGNRLPGIDDVRFWQKDAASVLSLPGPAERQMRRHSRNSLEIVSFAERSGADSDGQHLRYWYFVSNVDRPGWGYIIGFDSITKQRLGYFGTKGFRKSVPPLSEQFDGTQSAEPAPWGLVGNRFAEPQLYGAGPQNFAAVAPLVISGGTPWRISFYPWQLNKLIDRNDVLSAAIHFPRSSLIGQESEHPDKSVSSQFVLRTADRVLLLNSKAEKIQEWKLPPQAADQASTFALLDDETLLAIQQRPIQYPVSQVEYFLTWVTPADEVTRTERFLVEYPEQTMSIVLSAMRLSGCPLFIGLSDGFLLPIMSTKSPQASYGQRLKQLFPVSMPWYLLAVLSATLSIILARRWGNRHHVPLHPAWTVIIALLGIPGYFGYRWHRHWPPEHIPATLELNGTEILVPVV